MNRSRFAVIALAWCLALAPLCSAATYTVTDLGVLDGTLSFGNAVSANGQVTGRAYTSGNSFYHAFLYDGVMHDLGAPSRSNSEGFGINSSGQVTGDLQTSTGGPVRAFLYDGTMHDVGTLGASDSYGRAINSSGQIAGYSGITPHTFNGDAHAFIFDGTMHDLGTLGGTNSQALGINDSRQTTGTADTGFVANSHAFLYDGAMHDLGTLGGISSVGNAINASGQVAGSSLIAGNRDNHAFLWTPTTPNGASGAMHDLGTLGGSMSIAYGINASGQVTGYSNFAGDFANGAFVYDSTHGMVNLTSLIDGSTGWNIQRGYAINDAGQITGFGQRFGGPNHALLLTPVPEPASAVLAAVGLTGLVLCRRLLWRR